MPDPREAIEPAVFVILGATGDLAERELLPTLYRLHRNERFASPSVILGASRRTLTDEEYRRWAREALAARLDEHNDQERDIAEWTKERLYYVPLPDSSDYTALAERIAALEREHRLPGNRVFYLAIPPGAFGPAITALGARGLDASEGWTRLVLEKPFGRDLESSRELNEVVHRHFDEEQIYRIDHYLGKETVQNLLVFRFANMIFESIWNRERIDSVQITVAEKTGAGHRAGYYDRSGALRDMVQNHLTQLLTLTTMEAPVHYDARSIRNEKVKVLQSVSEIRPEEVVFGQYGRGILDGDTVPGYTEELEADSRTETFVAVKLAIENWRWQGVPFYLRTGKRLPRKVTQIRVCFREAPICLFESFGSCQVQSNVLVITLQPDEGFQLWFDVKEPGDAFALQTLPLSFRYEEAFGALPTAYETLLVDIFHGDQTLFVQAEEADESWALYTPLLEREIPVHTYDSGTWGPGAADELLRRDGQEWHIH